MARTEYNKLIRDRIPEIIASKGDDCFITEILDNSDFEIALRDKLVEEAKELRCADDDSLVDELADIYELLDTFRNHHGITPEQIAEARMEKLVARGGFQKRLKLHWAESKSR